MSIERKADAEWRGDLQTGNGQIRLGSGAYQGPYSFKERTSQASSQTNPEELIGAALAGCYSMQLSALLAKASYKSEQIQTIARVIFELDPQGPFIAKIHLRTTAKVPGIDEKEFKKYAETAKTICPISKALKAVTIELTCELLE